MSKNKAAINFAIAFTIGAALAGFYLQQSIGYMIAYCSGGAVGGAIVGYLLGDRSKS